MRIALCLTCFERMDPYAESAFLDLAIQFGRTAGIEMVPFVRYGLSCADACNALMDDVDQAEKQAGYRFDRIFWMDDDICLYPEDLAKLLASVDAEHSGVFALAFYRRPPYQASMWRYELSQKFEGLRQWAKLEFITEYPPDTLVPVHCAGLCAAVFDRAVFDKITKPYFAWIEGGVNSPACTPDGFLCAKLRLAGVPLHCHTGVRTKHIGAPELVDEALAVQHRSEWKMTCRSGLTS